MRLPRLLSPGPRLRLFAAVTIASAAVISFESLKHLAEHAGFGHFAFLFPLTLDAVAALGMDLWVTRSPAWKQARALALAAIGGSLVGNIADHWISQGTILPAVLGAVPPGMLAALLAVLHRHASGTASVRSAPDTSVRDAVWRSLPQADRYRFGGPSEPVRTVIPIVDESHLFADQARRSVRPVPPEIPRSRPVRSEKAPTVRAPRGPRSAGPADDVIVKALRDHAAYHSGRLPSKRDVMAQHSVGSGRALRLLALAKEKEVPTDG